MDPGFAARFWPWIQPYLRGFAGKIDRTPGHPPDVHIFSWVNGLVFLGKS